MPQPTQSAISSAESCAPAGKQIADRLHRYEELLREAHVAGLELALDLRRVQGEAGLSAIAAHGMFARFDEAQAQVSAAIASAAVGHRLARTIAPAAGIDPSAYGENTDPDEAAFGRSTGRALAQVA